MSRVLSHLSPIDLARLALTGQRYRGFVFDHKLENFEFYRAVERHLYLGEAWSLQALLDFHGAFIWGVAAYEYFTRDYGAAGKQTPDLDIFVNTEHFWPFMGLLEHRCRPRFEYAGTPEAPTMKQAARALSVSRRQHPDPLTAPPVHGILRFVRDLPRGGYIETVGVRLIATRRSPWDAMLRAKTSACILF